MKVGNQFSTENGRFLFLSFLLYFFLWIFSPGLSYYYFREKREKNDFDLRPVSVQIRIGGQVGGVLPRGRSYRPGLLWVGFLFRRFFWLGGLRRIICGLSADYLRINCRLSAIFLSPLPSPPPPPTPPSPVHSWGISGKFSHARRFFGIFFGILWDSFEYHLDIL